MRPTCEWPTVDSRSDSSKVPVAFRHSHFGALDQKCDIGRICIAIATEALAGLGLVHCGFKRPAVSRGIAEFSDGPDTNSRAMLSAGQSQQPCMCYVQPAFKNGPTPVVTESRCSDVSAFKERELAGERRGHNYLAARKFE